MKQKVTISSLTIIYEEYLQNKIMNFGGFLIYRYFF